MRLFVAVNFPGDMRRDIWNASAALRSASLPVRWVEESALHVTLKFLGDVAPDRRDDLVTTLGEAADGTRAFTLPVTGFGAFPSVERPRVIWVGCEGVPTLELLQHRLEQWMERLGFPLEGRAFHPHLTLGRVKQGARSASFARLEQLLEGVEYAGECVIRSVELMESTLGHEGAHYRPVHSVTFRD